MFTKNSLGSRTEMSRRTFLKLGLAASGAAVLAGSIDSLGLKGLLKASAAGNTSGSKWVKSYCSSCIFANCGTEVKVVNGVAVEIRGNKDHPCNKGTLCPRGSAQLMNIYNPYRVKAPLKRTNPEKGIDVDPGWVEISWEEAFQTVGDRLSNIQQTDPRRFAYLMGFAANPHENCMQKITQDAFGTPNQMVTSGPLCEVHYGPKTYNASYIDRTDLQHCNYLILFGRNGSGSVMHASGPARALGKALERGMKVIWVAPHASADASKGEWVPIRPATDMAMGMAMLYTILHEIKVFDVESVKNNTNAPYLINSEGVYQRDPESEKPLVWDLSDNKAKVFDDPGIRDMALEGEYAVDGEKVSPSFVMLKNSVAGSTPEWAENICGVAADTIRRLTAELVEEARIGSTITIDGFEYPCRPAAIGVGRGAANQPQGRKVYMVANIINVLLGGIGVPGSILSVPPAKFDIVDGMLRSDYQEVGKPDAFTIPQNSYNHLQFYPMATFPILGSALRAIIEPEAYFFDYEIDTLLFYGSNPFQCFADPEVAEKAFAKIPFTFTVGYHIDEPALFADIIFPEASHYERCQTRIFAETMAVDEETIDLYGLNYKESVLESPLYDTKQYEDVILELCKRVGTDMRVRAIFNGFYGMAPDKGGLNPEKAYTYKEMLDVLLKVQSADPDKGVDYFSEHGFFTRRLPLKECYNYYNTVGKARLPVYDEYRLTVGRELRANIEKFNIKTPGFDDMDLVYEEYIPLPEWHDNFLTIPSSEFDLFAVNWKISPRHLGLGGQDDNPWLLEVVHELEFDDLHIQINTATAEARGLKTGDCIVVESQHGGKLEGVIKTTELIHPECLGFPGNAGRRSQFMNPKSRLGCNYNQLLTAKEGLAVPDDGAVPLSARIKISKI